MSYRYFSAENKLDESNQTSSTFSSTTTYVEAFSKQPPKDYLMQKLYTPRFSSNNQNKSATNTSLPQTSVQKKPDRNNSEFQEEFIPLKRNVVVEENNEHQTNVKLYPYPMESIQRVRKHMLELLSENSEHCRYESNQTSRMIEILKLKLNMKSKFDNDQRLRRMIERDKFEAKKSIEDRVKYVDKRANLKSAKNKHTVIELSSSSDEEEEKRAPKIFNKDDEDDERDDIKDIMGFIDDEDKVICLSGDEEESDEVKEDSKCHQYGKYRANKRKQPSNKASTSLPMNLRAIQTTNSLGNDELDIEAIEKQYKSLKNRKIKLRKNRNKNKLSKFEINAERELIIAEMRKNRTSRRKLKKQMSKSQKTFATNANNSSSVELFKNKTKSLSKKQKRKQETSSSSSSLPLVASASFNSFSANKTFKKIQNKNIKQNTNRKIKNNGNKFKRNNFNNNKQNESVDGKFFFKTKPTYFKNIK
jgi:hypothetical protein